MEGKTVGILITAFIAILLGVILITIISGQVNDKTTTKTQTDTLSIASARLVKGDLNATYYFKATDILTYPASRTWKTYDTDCQINSLTVSNGTDTLVETTNYVWVADADGTMGELNFVNSTDTKTMLVSNTTYLTYDYCGNDYIAEGWERSVIKMVPGFFALAILGVALLLVMWLMRKEAGVDLI